MRLRLEPHRSLTEQDWTAGDWFIRIGESEPRICMSHLPEFDYDLRFSLFYEFEADLSHILDVARLPHDAVIAAYATADCQAAGIRLSGSTIFNSTSRHRVEIAVAPGLLAGGVELHRGLALLGAGTVNPDSTAATRPGSKLLQVPSTTLRLEDNWSRFPIEAVDFAVIGLPDIPWYLRTSYENLNDPFMGCVRLLVNVGHPAGKEVLDTKKISLTTQSALRVDLIRQLLLNIAVEQPLERLDWDADSIAGIAHSIASTNLHHDLSAVLAMARDNPIEFEKLLHDKLGYLRGEG